MVLISCPFFPIFPNFPFLFESFIPDTHERQYWSRIFYFIQSIFKVGYLRMAIKKAKDEYSINSNRNILQVHFASQVFNPFTVSLKAFRSFWSSLNRVFANKCHRKAVFMFLWPYFSIQVYRPRCPLTVNNPIANYKVYCAIVTKHYFNFNRTKYLSKVIKLQSYQMLLGLL